MVQILIRMLYRELMFHGLCVFYKLSESGIYLDKSIKYI